MDDQVRMDGGGGMPKDIMRADGERKGKREIR